jgi:succinoglycan biosynthesis protein ExoM
MEHEYGRNGLPRVAVCIATYRRIEPLSDLLAALARLTFEKVRAPDIEIIIVDNDSSRTAEDVCKIEGYPWRVRYFCEPVRGIARARNRAIDEVTDANFLAFVDDDELPGARWLDELLWAQGQFQADVVSGPLVPAYTAGVPKWIRNGGFFRRPIFRSGETVKLCSTNNVLIRSSVLFKVPGFDELFNLTGGEDTHFFLRVRESGFRMIFSREAIVYEPVTEKRANVPWLLRRGYQAGNSWALCERKVKPRDSTTRGFKGIGHICRGLAHALVSMWFGKSAIVRDLQELCAGAGMLAGALGHRFQPYDDSAIQATSRAITLRRR